MPDFLKRMLSGFMGAIVAKVTRWIATAAATATAAWLYSLLSKYGLPPTGHIADAVKEIAGGIFSVVSGGGALAYAIWDVKNAQTKMLAAKETGVMPPTAEVAKALLAGQQQGVAAQADKDAADAARRQAAIDAAQAAAPKTVAAALERLRDHTA